MTNFYRTNLLILFLFTLSLVAFSSSKSISTFGCIPNSGKDLTKEFQKSVDFVYENQIDSLIIPGGMYSLNSIDIPPGITIIGKNRPTLIKVANAGKWSRMFNTQTGKYTYDQVEDSRPLVIANIQFNGNYQNQGVFQGYELQQQHLIMICAKPTSKGRFVAKIFDCSFSNSVADGIGIYTNADVHISNCTAQNIFRGGIVLGGGNSKLQVDNFRGSGKLHPSGFHIEVDGAGYNGMTNIEVNINHMILEDGHFDIVMFKGTVFGNDIVCKKPLINVNTNGEGEVKIRNSVFYCGNNQNSTIFFPKKVTFDDCTFYCKDSAKGSCCFYILNSAYYHSGSEQKLFFNHCIFESKISKNSSTAIIIAADQKELHNSTNIFACKFINFATGFEMRQGGNLNIDFSEFKCTNSLNIGYSALYLYQLSLKRINFNNKLANKINVAEYKGNIINFDKNYIEQQKK